MADFKAGDALINLGLHKRNPPTIAVITNVAEPLGFSGVSYHPENGWWSWTNATMSNGWELHPDPESVWLEYTKWTLVNG